MKETSVLIETVVILLGLGEPWPGGPLPLGADLTDLAQMAVNGVVVGSILSLAAVGLTMVYGILRIANFAHGDLLTLGSYVALYLFALVTIQVTLVWSLGVAALLVVLALFDRVVRPRLGHGPSLSYHEAVAVSFGATALLVLAAGVAFPQHVPPGMAALVVTILVTVPLALRCLRAARRRLVLGLLGAGIVMVAAHLIIPIQMGPGGASLATEGSLGLAALAIACFTTVPTPGRDRMVITTLAGGGLIGLFLFASPILLAIALALGAVAVFAVVLERLVWLRARRQGAGLLTLIIISIGIMLALRNSIVILWGTRQRAFPDTLRRGEAILGTEVLITPHQALAVTVAILMILLLHLFLRHAKVGKAMRALGDDMELARVSGIRVDRVVLYVWIIAGALAALAGILFGMVRPFDPNLGWHQLLPIFAAVILGGIGSPHGALLGGFTIGLAMETAPFFGVPTDYKLAVGFGILILVMIFRPTGILGGTSTR